jgi:hypothetical protein
MPDCIEKYLQFSNYVSDSIYCQFYGVSLLIGTYDN